MQACYTINIAVELYGALSLLIIFVGLLLDERRGEPLQRRLLRLVFCDVMVLLSDAASFLLDGFPAPWAGLAVRAANFLVYSLSFLLLLFFSDYLMVLIAEKARIGKTLCRVVGGICLLGILLSVVSQWNDMLFTVDENHVYHRQSLFWMTQTLGILCMAIHLGVVLAYRRVMNRREFCILLIYQLLPICGLALQIFVEGPSFLNAFTALSISILSSGIQVEQSRQLELKEKEVTENRIAIMLSQIQPHFLYNSLVAIRQLCDIDPEQAKQAVVEFSGFLRGNMDSLTHKEPIPFRQEMDHLKNYLALENKRFGNRLKVEYDLDAQDFALPALTLQPIVENAVHYGITKKEQGGTVVIHTRRCAQGVRIVVKDDGVGFDTARLPQDGRTHIGIENVRSRLWALCGGTVEVQSEVGVGTVVTMTIPLKGAEA